MDQDLQDKLDAVIERVETARAEGLTITADMYTYTAGATGLDASMPPSVQEGGFEAWRTRLQDPAIRTRLEQEMNTPTDAWENLYLAAGADNVLLVGFSNEALRGYTGKTLAEVAAERGTSPAITAMDLVIEDGEFVAVLGPSGCGKSTTLFMLAGIYAPTGGALTFDGAVVNEVEARDRNVGIVFQSYALYPHMNVLQNIMFPLRFKSVPEHEARSRAEEAARLVQVEELLDRRPGQMSGGQQQRVALARALVKQPQLLLLDEPLSNLDATLRLSMRTEIKKLQRQLGVTTILVTHDQLEATTMADRIICMSQGRIEQVGSPDDLYLRPPSLVVAGFIGAPPINLLPGQIGGEQETGEGERNQRGDNRTSDKGIGGQRTVGEHPDEQ